MLLRVLITVAILFAMWVLLSGHLEPLLLSLGLISCLFVAWISYKFALLDPESKTLRFVLNLPKFLPWFFIQIVKSNIDVSWRILHPKLPITPTISSLPISQHSEVAKATYANCITLTPGTYSLNINSEEVEVHSLTKSAAKNLQKGEMSKRIKNVESFSHKAPLN